MPRMMHSLLLTTTLVLALVSCDLLDDGDSELADDLIWVTEVTDDDLNSSTTYNTGDRITLWLVFDREVWLSGVSNYVVLNLKVGNTEAEASLRSSGEWNRRHKFSYLVRSHHRDADGIEVTGINIMGHIVISDRDGDEMQGTPIFEPFHLSNVLVNPSRF